MTDFIDQAGDGLPRMTPEQQLRIINKQLEEALWADAGLDTRKQRAKYLRKDIVALEGKIEELGEISRKEHAKVDNLARMSWSSLWHRLRGRLKEQIELKQQDAARSLLLLKEAGENLEALKSKCSQADEELADLYEQTRLLAELMRRKEELIGRFVPQVKAELDRMDIEQAAGQRLLTEMREAENACRELCTALDKALLSLESASTWGSIDMLGGGLISTRIKHNRIDEAQASLDAARAAAKRLESELQDLGRESSYVIPISDRARLGDYLLDGFFMDWHIQSKITKSRESTRELLRETRALYRRLQADRDFKERELANLQLRREKLIAETGR